jgi:diketogulonate reductase-like aldo/keto reductase
MLEDLKKTLDYGPAIYNRVVGDAATSAAAIAYCNEHSITFLAYSPLHSYVPGTSISNNTMLPQTAAAHGVLTR